MERFVNFIPAGDICEEKESGKKKRETERERERERERGGESELRVRRKGKYLTYLPQAPVLTDYFVNCETSSNAPFHCVLNF